MHYPALFSHVVLYEHKMVFEVQISTNLKELFNMPEIGLFPFCLELNSMNTTTLSVKYEITSIDSK